MPQKIRTLRQEGQLLCLFARRGESPGEDPTVTEISCSCNEIVKISDYNQAREENRWLSSRVYIWVRRA